jgi:hypothetical protein
VEYYHLLYGVASDQDQPGEPISWMSGDALHQHGQSPMLPKKKNYKKIVFRWYLNVLFILVNMVNQVMSFNHWCFPKIFLSSKVKYIPLQRSLILKLNIATMNPGLTSFENQEIVPKDKS